MSSLMSSWLGPSVSNIRLLGQPNLVPTWAPYGLMGQPHQGMTWPDETISNPKQISKLIKTYDIFWRQDLNIFKCKFKSHLND